MDDSTSFRDVKDAVDASIEEYYNPKVTLQVSGDIIEFFMDDYNFYQIPISECLTLKGFTDWLFHLYEKNWVNEQILRKFAQIICEAEAAPKRS